MKFPSALTLPPPPVPPPPPPGKRRPPAPFPAGPRWRAWSSRCRSAPWIRAERWGLGEPTPLSPTRPLRAGGDTARGRRWVPNRGLRSPRGGVYSPGRSRAGSPPPRCFLEKREKPVTGVQTHPWVAALPGSGGLHPTDSHPGGSGCIAAGLASPRCPPLLSTGSPAASPPPAAPRGPAWCRWAWAA